jgi:hypothetical protein
LFRTYGLWFTVEGSGSRIQGSELRVQGRVEGLGFEVQSSEFRVEV